MKLFLNQNLAKSYKSLPQKIRVMTEDWVSSYGFCPACGNNLRRYKHNKPVADFYCQNCKEEFELKSKKNNIGNKIVDGAYRTMIERLRDINNPNFFMLSYDPNLYQVFNFFVIPKHFFVPGIIEKRKPLSIGTRRSGWMGCNILLNKIPESGRIFFIKDKYIEPKKRICAIWQKTSFLRQEKNINSRGWILSIMRCIELLGKKEFTLADIYRYENMLSKQYPDNKHIKDKIRQQLQVLRDRNYIQFIGRGKYCIT